MLRIGFAGTPVFAADTLNALLNGDNTHTVLAVYTQPDKLYGRGQKEHISPVKQLALTHNLPVYQPQKATDISLSTTLDVLVVVAYGMLLPKSMLNAPRFGCINIHASLLPKWRGAAPVQRAIEAGDSETGISIIRLDEGLDTGPIITQASCPIDSTDTTAALLKKLTPLGIDTLLKVLANLTNGNCVFTMQTNKNVSYAKKILPEESKINWSKSALSIERKIRALNPSPIMYTYIGTYRVRIWQADVLKKDDIQQPHGKIICATTEGIQVATGKGILRILKLQFPGKTIIHATDFVNGYGRLLIDAVAK